MPACSFDSRRDPARTNAATETERAPGRRVEITRGPSASAVRWNIAGMVPERPSASGKRSGRRLLGTGRVRCRVRGYLGRYWLSQFCRKNTTKAIETTHMSGWISLTLPRATLIRTQEMKPAPMPMEMS